MTFEEYLKTIEGLTDEQASAIIGGMKENKLYISGEENIDERYAKLKTQHDDTNTQLRDAQDLIAQLKPQADGSEALKKQIADFEQKAADAEARAAKAERDSALKIGLLSSGAKPEDIDYLMYRIDTGDAEVKVGDDGKLAGMDEAVKALKTKFPNQFAGDAGKAIDENKLPPGDGGNAKAEPQSLEEALKSRYENEDR